jgi:polysaccharide biosynthesis transport protein
MEQPMDNSRQLPAQPENALVRTMEVVYRDHEPPTSVVDMQSGSGLVEYWRIIARHRGTVLLLLFLGGLVGFLMTLPETPVYRAHATLEVQGLNQNFLDFKDVSPNGGSGIDPTADILTQVKLLESQSLRERAVAKLKAQPPSSSLSIPRGGRPEVWAKALHLNSGAPVTWDSSIGMAAGSVTVRASGTTRIIDVSSDSTDPKVAAEFANTLVNQFIEDDLDSRMTDSERTGQWLTRQLDELKIKLEKSEDQLQGYANTVGLQLAGSEGKDGTRENVADAKLRQLQGEMLNAQSERVKAQSKSELISSAPVDSLPQVLDDASLREYQTKLADLRRQMAELSVSLTQENPKIQKIQAQIAEVENALAKERANIVIRIKNEFDAASRRERMVTEEYNRQLIVVDGQATKSVHYDILKRESDTNHQIYESMLQKVKEAGIASAMRASNYKIVDPARTPGGPYKPNPTQNATMGSLGGLVLGILFVLVRERADRSLQQPGDAAQYLNLPELGVIPSDRAGTSARLYGGRSGPPTLIPTPAGQEQDVALATYKRRPSLLAESFHDTLTSILFSGKDGLQPRVIALCSSSPSEGKTTVSSNLAAALADINQKVLLIDADMRRPRMHHIFSVTNTEGLSSLLKGNAPVLGRPREPIIVETQVPGLSLMPSGPAVSNASNLLYSPRFAEVIRAIRNDFDYVLIDTPPMLQLADARIISQHCDTVILVIRAGKTTRDAARAARQKFQQDGTPILGTILNDWVPGLNGYGYDKKYYDRYAKYYNVKNA